MCGILGTLPASDKIKFENALSTIAHRGPDHAGIWTSNPEISLGQRRLSILDLSEQGNQPMFDISDRFAIVLNGEIYNFIEIQKELIAKGHKFKSTSDTEVVLYSFIEWGPDCLNKFNGMWAFAIWDNLKKELFLSRDRFGKKPLFYAVVNGKFIFASEMKAIYRFLPELRASKDFSWMSKNIFLYENTDKCLIEGIKRFPAGNYGILSNEKLTIQRYWNTLDNLKKVPDKYEDQVEEFRNLFIDACRIRMRSDVAIGTALSGGLDSSAIIGTMAHIAQNLSAERMSKDWQHAYVATFNGTPLDESYYAKKVVDHLKINATYIDIDPLKSWSKLEYWLYQFEELYITSPIPMIQLYGAVRENNTTVTIDGHGADELFCGYSGSLLEALPDAFPSKEKINSIFNAYYDLFTIPIRQRNQFIEFLDYYLRRKVDVIKGKSIKPRDFKHHNYNKLDRFNKHLYQMSHETVLPTLLRNYDRYSMINGVEIRMPFMDYRVVCYAMSLKWESKIREGYTKAIVRDAISPFLPAEIIKRKTKIGFNTPIVQWMQNQLKEYFIDIVHSKSFLECELINSKRIKKMVLNVIHNPKAQYTEGETAWRYMIPYFWEQAILKKKY